MDWLWGLYVAKIIAFRLEASLGFYRLKSRCIFAGLGISDGVFAEDQVDVLSLEDDAAVIVQDSVLLEDIPMGPVLFRLVAKPNAVLFVRGDGIVAKDIVRILHPDGDSVTLVVREIVVFENAALHPPAKEQPIPFVAGALVVPHHCLKRPAPRVQTDTEISLAEAVFNQHPFGGLKANAVPVVVSDRAVADGDVLTFEQVNATSPASRQVFHFVPVAVDREPFQFNLVDTP